MHERNIRTSRDVTVIGTPTVRMERPMDAGRYNIDTSVREPCKHGKVHQGSENRRGPFHLL